LRKTFSTSLAIGVETGEIQIFQIQFCFCFGTKWHVSHMTFVVYCQNVCGVKCPRRERLQRLRTSFFSAEADFSADELLLRARHCASQ